MKLRTQKDNSTVIVYDADEIEQAGPDLFDELWWKSKNSVVGLAEGRGSALILETSFGPAVLRRYLRGGWAAGVSRDRYLFTGYSRSRPVAEFHLMAKLRGLGLPVPHPLAAQCTRQGLSYSGGLLTRRIMDVQPLAELMLEEESDPGFWQATGRCIRQFHDHGVIHADLNARNIMIQASGDVFLIDFDRARIRKGAKLSFASNLRRLKRSLVKFWPEGEQKRLESGWVALVTAYGADSGGGW